MHASRVEILLWICITFYGLSGLGTFIAYIPKIKNSDDEFVKSNIRNYLFRLLSSIIFFLYAIFFADDWRIALALEIELVALIFAFIWFVFKKKRYITKTLKKIATNSKHKFF
jgi:predicted membrane channel-forming protein YqfA (hemolysin III family)